MRLAISNIAWDVSEDELISKLLQKYHINAIDIAPGKYFPEPHKATAKDIHHVKQWWADRDIEITGMQSLLFGTTGLNVFGSIEIQKAMLEHLTAVCKIASGLGSTRLVFGSPKNRDRSGLTDQEALDIAIPFFRRLGDIAKSHSAIVCLEPNPACYGANFMLTSNETAEVVKQIDHPAIKMQLDTGALTINGEEISAVLEKFSALIGHIHASEPQLLPLGDGSTPHRKIYENLIRYLPKSIVSIEMLATQNEPHEASIERALRHAILYYHNN